MGKLKLRRPRNLPMLTQPASRRASIKSKYVRTQSPTLQDSLKARGRDRSPHAAAVCSWKSLTQGLGNGAHRGLELEG